MKSPVKKKCLVRVCNRLAYAKGYCNAHYQRQRNGLPVDVTIRPNRSDGVCLARDSEGRKQCVKCLLWLDSAMFGKHDGTLDQLQVRCRACVNNGTRLVQYGLDEIGIASMMEAQDHKCAICGSDISGRYTIDHNHECCPGRKTCGTCVRGLLCDGCNLGLGAFQDDPIRMENAVRYLRSP